MQFMDVLICYLWCCGNKLPFNISIKKSLKQYCVDAFVLFGLLIADFNVVKS